MLYPTESRVSAAITQYPSPATATHVPPLFSYGLNLAIASAEAPRFSPTCSPATPLASLSSRSRNFCRELGGSEVVTGEEGFLAPVITPACRGSRRVEFILCCKKSPARHCTYDPGLFRLQTHNGPQTRGNFDSLGRLSAFSTLPTATCYIRYDCKTS